MQVFIALGASRAPEVIGIAPVRNSLRQAVGDAGIDAKGREESPQLIFVGAVQVDGRRDVVERRRRAGRTDREGIAQYELDDEASMDSLIELANRSASRARANSTPDSAAARARTPSAWFAAASRRARDTLASARPAVESATRSQSAASSAKPRRLLIGP